MDQFTETALINRLAGNGPDADWAIIERQFKLIYDEVMELREAIEARDINKVRGEACDVLFTTHGLQARAGFDGNEDYAEVCESQYRKFDKTEEEAMRTKEKFEALGVETYFEASVAVRRIHGAAVEQEYFVTFSARDQIGKDGKSYPQGKWLKSCAFLPPMFMPLDDAVVERLLDAGKYPEQKVNIFHDHLDVCLQCRENPMGLCRIGDVLLRQQVRFGGVRGAAAETFGL